MNPEPLKCRCGHTKDSPFVSVKTKYSKSGWLALSLAYSAKPIEVIFQCQKCGEVIETSRDPELLVKYRYNSDISK
jgi:hypothetical protein